MSFGEIIRSARRNLDWTQDELAAKLSCRKTAVCKWETNKSLPSIARVKMLAKTFGINPEILFDSIGRPYEPSRNEAANIDPLLLKAWEKLDAKQRQKLIKIAFLLCERE